MNRSLSHTVEPSALNLSRRVSDVSSEPEVSSKKDKYHAEMNIKNVKKLTQPSGYRLWKKSMTIILKYKKLYFLVEKIHHGPDYETVNHVVINMFLRTLGDNYVNDIVTMDTAYDVWTYRNYRICVTV